MARRVGPAAPRAARGGTLAGAPRTVLHVAETAGWAGGEAYLLRLAEGLDRRRFRLAVVVPEAGVLVGRLQGLGVPAFRVPLAARLVSPGALAALVALLRREQPAVVQSHGARSNVYTKLAARLAGVPRVIATVHNSLFDYDVGALRTRLYVAAERLTSPLAHRVVAVSRAVAGDLVARYRLPAAKVVTIQNGIDADAVAPRRSRAEVVAALGLEPDAVLVGMAARMTRQKGHDVLLEALRLLAPRAPRLRCVLVGDGPLEPDVRRRAAALGIGDRCVFTGARDDVPDLLAALDVVALASRSEGLPFVLLEAMAVGRPVVATAVGGNAEAVEDGVTGLLVPPEDPPALAAALARLLERPDEARAMGVRGGRRVREHFGLGRMIGGLEALYGD